MQMYEIKGIEKNFNRRKKIMSIVIAILIIALSIFAAIKLANYLHEEKMAKNENIENKIEVANNNQKPENNRSEEKENKNEITENIEEKENNSQAQNTSKNNQNFTDEQIAAINNIYSSKEKRAFLTFDDGPSQSVTPKILDTLKKENIKATFFVLGTMVKSNPDVLKREYEEGHYIGNHGYSHVYKNIYANKNNPLEEYKKTNQIIQNALENPNYQSNVFRFPGGSIGGYYDKMKTEAKKVLKENNIAYLDWNALTNDSDGAKTKEDIIKNLKNTTKGKNSIVVLMHDAPNKSLTAETLPDVITYLKEQGYTFKNLYDII